MFYREFCEILKNKFFTEQLRLLLLIVVILVPILMNLIQRN